MKLFTFTREECDIIVRKFSLSVCSGIMLGFAFPPSPVGILACCGLVPLLIVLDETEGTGAALRWVYVAMLIFHMITLNWTGGYAHMNDPYMMLAGAITMTVHPLFYFIPFGIFLFIRRRWGKPSALAGLPFVWVAYEYSHTLSEWSFPWLTLGNTQSYSLARMQIVSYTGVIGLSLWILVLNILTYVLLESVRREGVRIRDRRNVAWLTAIVVVSIAPTIYGMIVLRTAPPVEDPLPPTARKKGKLITVGMIQANVDPWEKWQQTGFQIIEQYVHMTDSLVRHASPKPDVVLWPETAMPYYILLPNNRAALALVRAKVEEIGVPVLFGLPHAVYYTDTTKAPPSAKRIAATGERYDAFNAAAFLQPGVEEIPWYGKMKMVPLAERVPYADTFYFLDFLRWDVGIGGWQIGRDTVVFREKKTGARFCTLICYESVYPEFVAEFVKRGAEFITIITIDSWWDRMSGAYQHHQYAIFRAVENRRWVARCAAGGFSSFIDPYGRVYDKTELFTQAVLSRTLERFDDTSGTTFYTRNGDWVGRLAALVSLALIVGSLVVAHSRRRVHSAQQQTHAQEKTS